MLENIDAPNGRSFNHITVIPQNFGKSSTHRKSQFLACPFWGMDFQSAPTLKSTKTTISLNPMKGCLRNFIVKLIRHVLIYISIFVKIMYALANSKHKLKLIHADFTKLTK